ncbi:DNA protecting protein DprA [Dehalobacter sp. MCB1]|nr:DNA protecting protein DprA [Dehalobacter sp. MCB1]
MRRIAVVGGIMMKIIQEKVFRASILTIPGIGSQRLRQLIAYFGGAAEALEAPAGAFSELAHLVWVKEFLQHRVELNPERLQERLQREGISLVMPGEFVYPYLLAECADAPPVLFYKGVLQEQKEGIAVVGARKASPYGKAAASFLAGGIAREGYAVVSGLARGIDTAAHQGALEAGGITWAFMAGGLDTIYPYENKELANSIIEKGALLSEYPPGIPPEPGQFPARNRLISGSSRGVIVVEAAEKSGALITADYALEQGREVYAVPGPIFSELSRGTHQLLRMGAKVTEDMRDVLSELAPFTPESRLAEVPACLEGMTRVRSKGMMQTESKWAEILGCLSDVPLHIDRLAALCPLPAQGIALGLLELQLAGEVLQLPGQHYVLQR